MDTKTQILALLNQAMDLLESGNYTIEGISANEMQHEECVMEMAEALSGAIEAIGDYMD